MVKVFAPVNIAWIKYMGKVNGRPTNASFSMTLDQIGTTTEIRQLSPDGELRFQWAREGYVPPLQGQKKAESFLLRSEIWSEGFKGLDLPFEMPSGLFEIKTNNNVPAGTGIATSASGFAALTLAWFSILQKEPLSDWRVKYQSNIQLQKGIAAISALGSGSACRSFMGPFVEWDPELGVSAFDPQSARYTDFILILETNEKEVSSSEAHQRVLKSPRFSERHHRVSARLRVLKQAFLNHDGLTLKKTVLDEALDMHDLFHTAEPPFTYMNEESIFWIDRIRKNHSMLPSRSAILTLDAGANCHVFVPEEEEQIWDSFFGQQVDSSGLKLNYLKSRAGEGARFVD